MLHHDSPAAMTLSVLFVIGNPSVVDPLHCTTVPFSLVAAVNVRVEVMSATHYSRGVGSGCEGGYKVNVITMWR